MKSIYFPPEIDINHYKNSYPHLKNLSEELVLEDWAKYAETLGRTSCMYDSAEGMKRFLKELTSHAKVLEIGPFDNPFCEGKNVKYFEVMDATKLRERSVTLKRPFNRVPKHIDFVSEIADLSIVDEKFDVVFSSHVIEHQTDIVKHLQLVEDMLNDGGVYVMIIPDKRYCFDHFIPETEPSEVLGAYFEHQKLHPVQKVIEHFALTTHNDPVQHWLGRHGDNHIDKQRVLDAVNLFESRPGEYIDVHECQYTPQSFERIINTLNDMALTNLSIYRLCHTLWGRFEFCAILKKNAVQELNCKSKYSDTSRKTLSGVFRKSFVDGQEIVIIEDILGSIDEYKLLDGEISIRGWFYVNETRENSQKVICVENSSGFKIYEFVPTERQDVAIAYDNRKMQNSGFLTYVEKEDPPNLSTVMCYGGFYKDNVLHIGKIGELK